MFTRIITSSLLFLIAIGGFVVSYDTGSVKVSQSYAADQMTPQQIEAAAAAGVKSATTAAGKATDAESKWLNEAIQAFNVILGVLTMLVSPAIIFAGWLLSPDWTSGDLFGMRKPMHDMWVIVSNIIYFVYAILLIMIALGTIFGKDNFSYKTMLPKLALGILMVPFTWWFVQWTISLSTIVTASVMSIPMDMIKEDNKYINGNYIPLVYTTTTDASGKSSTTDSAEKWSSTKKCTGEIGESDGVTCTSMQKVLEKGGGTYSTLLIYAYQIFRIQDYKSIEGTLNQIKTGGQILNSIVIGAIMFIVFGILVMALIAMLLLRAIKLWMYAIFSPIFTLHFVAGKELFGKSTDGFNIKEFIGLCFVPAVVGLTLSFGLMIISVIHNPAPESTKCTNIKITNLETGEGGCKLISLFGNPENTITRGIWTDEKNVEWSVNIIKVAGLTYIYQGKGTNADDLKASTDAISGGLSAAGGIFGTIIIDIIALIFIWMAFMAAKGVSKAVEAAVKPFEDMGNKVGSMAASLPKYAPLPLPGGSIAGAGHLTSGMESKISTKAIDSANESALGKALGMDKKADGKAQTATANAVQAIVAKDGNGTAIKAALESLKENLGRGKDISEQTAKIADALKDLTKEDRVKVLAHTGIDHHALEKLVGENDNKKIDKNNHKLAAFQSIIVGSAPAGTPGNTTSSSFSKNEIKSADGKSTEINVNIGADSVKLDGTGKVTIPDGIIKNSKGKWTEDEFKKELNKILTSTDADKIITALKSKESDFYKPASSNGK